MNFPKCLGKQKNSTFVARNKKHSEVWVRCKENRHFVPDNEESLLNIFCSVILLDGWQGDAGAKSGEILLTLK